MYVDLGELEIVLLMMMKIELMQGAQEIAGLDNQQTVQQNNPDANGKQEPRYDVHRGIKRMRIHGQ